MTDGKRITINKIVGISKGELVVLEEVFEHSDNFKGAVGFRMGVLHQDYIDQQNDAEYLAENEEYLWREAVQAGQTELGLTDYFQELVDNCQYYDQEFPFDDNSFRFQTEGLYNNLADDEKAKVHELIGEPGEDFAVWSCSSCGRCFEAGEEWDAVFRPDLVELINRYESK